MARSTAEVFDDHLADSFLIRDGRIQAMTIHYTMKTEKSI